MKKGLIIALAVLMVLGLGQAAFAADANFSANWSGTGIGGTLVTIELDRATGPAWGTTSYEYECQWTGSSTGSVGGIVGELLLGSNLGSRVTGSGYVLDRSSYALRDIPNDNTGSNILSEHKVQIFANSYEVRDTLLKVDYMDWGGDGDDAFLHSQGFMATDADWFIKEFDATSEWINDPCPQFAQPEIDNFLGDLGFNPSSPFDVYSRTWDPYLTAYGRGAFDVFLAGSGMTGWASGHREYHVLIEGYDGPPTNQIYTGIESWLTTP